MFIELLEHACLKYIVLTGKLDMFVTSGLPGLY